VPFATFVVKFSSDFLVAALPRWASVVNISSQETQNKLEGK